MATCRICLHAFKSLKFETMHIGICARCVGTLNESPHPAKSAEALLAEKLKGGMQRNAELDMRATEEWKRAKAKRTLADLDTAVAAELHDWITRLLSNPHNCTPEVKRALKIIRAHRRGLLRMEGIADYRGWEETARRIRQRDGYKCMACDAVDTTLDVHHIIYLSHHGTNQQSNLVTLCRACHEAEHGRIFDWPEANDPESSSPIRPPPSIASAATPLPPVSVTDVTPSFQPKAQSIAAAPSAIDLTCPRCAAALTAKLKITVTKSPMIRCPSCSLVFSVSNGLDHRVTPSSVERAYEKQAATKMDLSRTQPVPNTAPSDQLISVAVESPESTPLVLKKRAPVSLWRTDLLVFAILALVVFVLIL